MNPPSHAVINLFEPDASQPDSELITLNAGQIRLLVAAARFGLHDLAAPLNGRMNGRKAIQASHAWLNDAGTAFIELFYPRTKPPTLDCIEVGLCDVRAADSIRISYDFDRDGYSIKQNATMESGEMLDDWQEVAFVKAWARTIGEGK